MAAIDEYFVRMALSYLIDFADRSDTLDPDANREVLAWSDVTWEYADVAGYPAIKIAVRGKTFSVIVVAGAPKVAEERLSDQLGVCGEEDDDDEDEPGYTGGYKFPKGFLP